MNPDSEPSPQKTRPNFRHLSRHDSPHRPASRKFLHKVHSPQWTARLCAELLE